MFFKSWFLCFAADNTAAKHILSFELFFVILSFFVKKREIAVLTVQLYLF